MTLVWSYKLPTHLKWRYGIFKGSIHTLKVTYMENNIAINQLKAISSASFSGPREGGGRAWFPLFAHALHYL